LNRLLQRLQQRAPGDIVLEGAGLSLSAAELLARALELSLWLKAGGFRTVALLADNSPAWAVLDLACQFEDICLVPVPGFFSASQRRHILQSAGAELLVSAESGDAPLPGLPGYSITRLDSGAALVPVQTSKITFTSGTTGEPKGVCLSFAQCLRVAGSLAAAIEVKRPRHLCVLPLSTLLENIGGLYAPLLAGGSIVLPPPADLGMQGSSGVDAGVFLEALERHRPQTMILVPQLLAVLDAALQRGWRAPSSLRFVAVGGARVAPALLGRVRAGGLPVYEGYGLSECASVVSLNRPGDERPGTSGKVLPHAGVSVVDGELRVSGTTFLGYLNQPQTWGTREVATGDIGQVDVDGFVTIRGRRNNVLISSYGRNISPEWVESELLAGGLFRQAVVVGNGRHALAALLVTATGATGQCAIQAEVDAVNARLPDYARIAHWMRLDTPFSPAEGLVTENGRLCRDRIDIHYRREIDQLYRHSEEPLIS
jgi:long-chain acyl-CoA synthetase